MISGRIRFRCLLVTWALLLTAAAGEVRGESESERRAKTGIPVFRTLLQADSDIAGKRAADGTLRLVLLAAQDGELTRQLVSMLERARGDAGKATISGVPVSARALTYATFEASRSDPVAGIFLADRLPDDQLRELVRFGIEKKIVVYSPHEGDVERGVLGGLSVEATVRPFINVSTLRASSLRIKPFFMKVARLHE